MGRNDSEREYVAKRGKLELTWVGKNERVKLEPRVLVEDPSKSYGDPKTENMLIYGDNLLALKALEQDFAGKIKCIYIDPPFNTGATGVPYDDNLENSIWLDLMNKRLENLHKLLREDGVIFIHLDDEQAAYMKVLLDGIFLRRNYRNTITIKANSPFGFKHTSDSIFKSANHLLVYSKTNTFLFKKLFLERGYDTAYRFVLKERNVDYSKWEWESIKDVVAKENGYETQKIAQTKLGKEGFEALTAQYAIENSERVFRTASVTGGARLKRLETLKKSAEEKNKVLVHPNDDMDYYFIGGERVLFYKERLAEIDGYKLPGEIITDIWTDISWEGIAKEGDVVFPKGKKPEALIKRVLEIATETGDWILDSFLGSGTTSAVAHKMGRKWIGIELGEHCDTHCLPRLKRVVSGEDQTGISKAVNWQGGGGFKYYRLAESLLVRDKDLSTKNHPVYIINPRYDEKMLIRAICKIENFRYRNNGRLHGISSESRFLHITTNLLTQVYLDSLAEDIGNDQSLLIYCTRRKRGLVVPDNIEIKKIPRDLLNKCDFEEDKK